MKSNTPSVPCVYKQCHLKDVEALPNLQDPNVKEVITYLKTQGIFQERGTHKHTFSKTTFTEGVSESPFPFSSVYRLGGKTTPSMRGMHWPTHPEAMTHPLWCPGLPAGSPRAHDANSTSSYLCRRDFPRKWVKWPSCLYDWTYRQFFL